MTALSGKTKQKKFSGNTKSNKNKSQVTYYSHSKLAGDLLNQ